jgi:hypothetical protein
MSAVCILDRKRNYGGDKEGKQSLLYWVWKGLK